ncbi:DUF4214 domain-containing protein [Paenibacillus sp. A3]|uniref:DUF4214 domain-containing protein n=1 Tax=Paenibacillus sp. A3 TaxID=1337054 RepID=UPI0009EBA8C4
MGSFPVSTVEFNVRSADHRAVAARAAPSRQRPYVTGLYRELLCREPDQEGLACHLSELASGHLRFALFYQFGTLEECSRLLSLPSSRPLAHKKFLRIHCEHQNEHQTGAVH